MTNAVSLGLDTSHGYDAQFVATDTNSIWGSDYIQNSVRRYDTTTGKLIASIAIPTAEGIVSAYGSTWVVSHHDGNLYRLDPSTNHVTAHAPLSLPGDGGLQEIASGFCSIWVGGGVDRTGGRSDDDEDHRTGPDAQRTESCGDLAVSMHDVWTTECLDSSHVLRVDPATQSASSYDAQGLVTTLSADGASRGSSVATIRPAHSRGPRRSSSSGRT